LTELRPYEGLFTLWTQTRCNAEMAMREARSRRQAGRLARLCDEVHGHFGGNLKGTGALARRSALLFLAKTPGLGFVKRLDRRAMPPVRVCVHSVNRP